MKPARIIILTGAKQSGKSTTLLQWSENKNVGGFLTLIASGKRMLFSLPEKVYSPFEATESAGQTISVGRYHFLKSSFDQMNTHLLNQSNNLFDYLIIDEIGPLELKGEGIYAGLTYLLNNASVPLLLVIREGLVQQVVDKFSLEPLMIATADTIFSLK